MDNKTIKQLIEKVLQSDDRLWNEEKKELNQTLLLDLVEHIDKTVIGLLLAEKDLRAKFFVKIKDLGTPGGYVYVFKTNDFRFFMEENKIDNSYTAYKNRIGLTDGKKFLKYTNDVVLDFPYKDCVLEGGQSTEEGADTYFEYSEKSSNYEEKQGKRKEIFFNQVLAHDEIDRLFDPKALTNWKRYTKDGEQEVKEIKRDEDGIIKENLIIKGNNLLALHSLKKQFAGKIKLIYIDPPYNTGGSGDTFAYNNTFKKSAWLTFMKNRIEVAKSILTDDGIICVTIDDYELPRLWILLEEIFGIDNHLGTVVIRNNPKGRMTNKKFSLVHEYGIFFGKTQNSYIKKLPVKVEDKSHNYIKDENGEWYLPVNLRKQGVDSNAINKKGKLSDRYYPIYFEPKTGVVSTKRKLSIEILPVDSNNEKRIRRRSKDVIDKMYLDGDLTVKETKNGLQLYFRFRGGLDGQLAQSIWYDSKFSASEFGTRILDDLLGKREVFSYPKSPAAIKQTILASSDDKNAIILDFFGGSGTTAHAVLQLNKEDGGNRKFILVEQMDYINTVTCPRVQKVMEKENIDDSFIYFELTKWNETAKEKILACESLNELIKFFDEMYERYFLNYNLKIKEFREKVIKEEEFKNLTLDEQKNMFIAMLDNNQMYVNKTEMVDKKFGISEEDQKLTDAFYRDKE